MLRVVCAFSILIVVGCRGPKEPAYVVESEVIRLDDAKVVQELVADRRGALEKYVGKIIEIEIDGIDVNEARDSKFRCELRPANSTATLLYAASFDLNDDLNSSLNGRKSGDFPAVIRGSVRAIDVLDERSKLFIFRIDQAWIRPTPRPHRSVMTILKENSIEVFCLFPAIFLGVTVFRISWHQDWGWFWGLLLTAIIVGLTFFCWPWGMLGAGALVGKLYKSYG